MLKKKWILSGICTMGIVGNMFMNLPICQAEKIPVIPVSEWKIEKQSGDKVSLKNQDGILAVKFDVDMGHTFLEGHVTYDQADFDLLFNKPVELDNKIERIIFEAKGLELKSKRSSTQIMLRPIIEDQEGEQFYYLPQSYPHLNSGTKNWGKWMTTSFYAGEAGAATSDIYYCGGKLKNTWPDGKLKFLGFKIILRKNSSLTYGKDDKSKKPRKKGEIFISNVQTGTLKLNHEPIYAYADSIFKDKGKYLLNAKICNEFQGIPVREVEKEFVFEPGNLNSEKQLLAFPDLPNDNYWLEYQITDENGKLVDSKTTRYQVTDNPSKEKLSVVDISKAPKLGFIRVNPGHPGKGVYQQGEPLKVMLRVFPKNMKNVKVSWKLTPYRFNDILDKGEKEIDFKDGKFQDLNLTLKPQAGRDAYRLEVTAESNGKVLDNQTYYLGFKTDLSKKHIREGKLANRNEIKQHSYFRTTYCPGHKPPKYEKAAIEHYRKYLANARQIGLNTSYMIDMRDFEVLPGVYDFAWLDKVMDTAADYGCKVNMHMAHADHNDQSQLYRWIKYSRQHNYDGTEIHQHHYGAYAVTDPRVGKLWLETYKALYDRYQQHTAFQGYYVFQPGGEWTVVDKPWLGHIAGYSEVTAEGFRNYLKNNLKLTLQELNKRWDTNYKSWQEVQAPLPDLRSGSTPDLRMSWLDFNRFKASLDTQFWFPKAVNSIREYDNDRLITVYGAPNKYKNLYGKLDYGHNGGNHYGENLGKYQDAWKKGKIGYITEPHHPHYWAAYGDPAQKGWVLDRSVWVMLSQAGGGGANLHIYYMPRNGFPNIAERCGGIYGFDRLEKYRPTLEELLSFELDEPAKQVAVMYDPETLYCKHRTTFGSRSSDLKRWFELLQEDSVLKEDYEKEHAANYKLLIPNILDEVMSLENVNELEKCVKAGSKMVITANTGKYVPELGKEPFQLLKKLGISAPQGPYKLTGTDVFATVDSSDNPLFAKGSKVEFFTLADLHQDIRTDHVKKNFWEYPYRWIPETDYFGYYPENKKVNGEVLARFASGGVAMSLHKVGKGKVIVFWGTPDMSRKKLKGMMAKAAKWAGVTNPRLNSPIPLTTEGHSDLLKRHYALLYQETPGSYTQKLLSVPDGEFFVDDMVSDQKLGVFTGKELRETGVPVVFTEGYSPLKIIRMIPMKQMNTRWERKYRVPPEKK